MNELTGNHSLLWSDQTAGDLELWGNSAPSVGGSYPLMEGIWRCLAGEATAAQREISPLLEGISAGPAVVAHVGRARGSQYRAMREYLASGGDLHRPVVCLAGSGEGFIGQSGRTWQAEPGNLHLTLALPCDLPAGPEAVALTALPALAVHGALKTLSPGPDLPGPGIKWVNDVLLDDGKVAGVLTSARSQGGRLTSVVLGIGLNVRTAPDLKPSVFTPQAVSLASAWPEGAPTLSQVLAAVLSEIEQGYLSLVRKGPGPILESYRDASLVLGRRVGIWPVDTPDSGQGGHPAPERSGIVTRICSDLSLELEGEKTPVTTGRLALLDGHGSPT